MNVRIVRAFLAVFFLTVGCIAAEAQNGQYQCRTSPNGASTSYCTSEAYVTQHFPSSCTAGHIVTCADSSGQQLADGGLAGAGTLLNGTVLAKTAAYAAASADCGDSITLGGSSQYTLTVNAASGYAANCAFLVTNLASETMTKTIAINGLAQGNFDLYPGLSFVVANESNTWVLKWGFPVERWKITSTESWYWRPLDGSDSACDGFTDAAASGATGRACAFASANKAAATIAALIDINSAGGGAAIMQADCSKPCTITDPTKYPALVGITFVGGPVQIAGDNSTPSNIKLVPTSVVSDGIQVTFPTGGGTINIGGFEVGGGLNISHGVYCSGHGQCNISGPMIFDAISSTPTGGWPAGCGITANAGAGVYLNATIFNTANIGAALCINYSANMEIGSAVTENTSNTPAWGSAFVFADHSASGNFQGMLFNGTGATGNRCFVQHGASLSTEGGGAAFFPGNVNCATPGTVQDVAGNRANYD